MKQSQPDIAVSKVQSIIQALGLDAAVTRTYNNPRGSITTFSEVAITSETQYSDFLTSMSVEWGQPIPVSRTSNMYVWETETLLISAGAYTSRDRSSISIIINAAANARSTVKAAAHLRTVLSEGTPLPIIDIGNAKLQTLDTCAIRSLPYDQDVYDDLCNEVSTVIGAPTRTSDNGDSCYWNLDVHTRLIVSLREHNGITIIVQVFMGSFK